LVLPRDLELRAPRAARTDGRSSDSRACPGARRGFLRAVASRTPCPVLDPVRSDRGRRSFPLTAAGQSRIRTGLPLASATPTTLRRTRSRARRIAEWTNHQHPAGYTHERAERYLMGSVKIAPRGRR